MENKQNPEELWQILKSLGIPFKRRKQSDISLKETVVVSFHSKGNANSFYKIFSNLVDSLLQKLS